MAMKRGKKSQEKYDYSKHFRLCEGGRYSVISCINLAFIEASIDTFKNSNTFELPHFSRDAVLWIYKNPPQSALDEVKKYVDTLFKAAKEVFGAAFRYDFTLDTPLTIHTKWPYLPLEIGIAWHPLLNVPYIPATSLKGAVRASSPSDICGLKPDEVFGTTEKEGAVIFFDAYLTVLAKEKPIEPDVLTPHYREVEGEIAEVHASPTPLVYPVVPPGSTFTFILAIKRREIPNNCETKILETLQNVLSKGLGAKTAVGYGVFRIGRL